jgi:hypothetical protein
MDSPSLICGSKPAGNVSVTMQMKPVMARASKPEMGRRSGWACLICVAV